MERRMRCNQFYLTHISTIFTCLNSNLNAHTFIGCNWCMHPIYNWVWVFRILLVGRGFEYFKHLQVSSKLQANSQVICHQSICLVDKWNLRFTLGPLHTLARGYDHVIVRAFDSHPKGHTIAIILCHAYLLEVGMTQKSTDHETLFLICHVGIRVDFSSMIISLPPRPTPSTMKWAWVVLAFFNQQEILELNDHEPSILCMKRPLDLGPLGGSHYIDFPSQLVYVVIHNYAM